MKQFIAPELEITRFDIADVITTSAREDEFAPDIIGEDSLVITKLE